MSLLSSALQPFLDAVRLAMGDAALISGSVKGLSGSYGRYAYGSRFGLQTATTAAQALQQTTETISAIYRILDALRDIAVAGQTDQLWPGIGTLCGAISDAATNPEDAVRILSGLAVYLPPNGTGAIGYIVAARCRQAALIALCVTTESVYLSSLTQAVALLSSVGALLDAEILYCGDTFRDHTYKALIRLKTSVARDIFARGASLAPLRTYTTQDSLPSALISQSLYGDGSRDDEIVDRVDPIHPAFCPTSMTLLAR